MKNLPRIIQRAAEYGDRTAILSGSTKTSYQQLVEGSQTIAANLLGLPDDAHCNDLQQSRVAYLVQPGEQYVQTQWGIWHAGGVAVPISLSATEKEIEYTLSDSGVSVVVSDGQSLKKSESLCNRLNIRLINLDDLRQTQISDPGPDLSTDRDAMILYTSGTTSRPKGVVSTHACIESQITSLIEAWHWQTDDRIALFLPLHHIHGIINVMSCALWSGATIDALGRFDVDTIFERVRHDAYTVFMAVPTIYVKMIEALEKHSDSDRNAILQGFAKMRLMVSGSAALPASVHEKWTELTGQKLLERYGMTEIGMALSNPYHGERRPGAVGQPLPGVEVRLVGESGDVVTDDNTPGEIQVRGSNLFREYWNRPQATAESFVDGWFRTGDMAVIEDGSYRIMGRTSIDIIKSGGYKLSALEIEAALLDHPDIAQCAVIGMDDETWGEAVAAAVVLSTSNPHESDTLDLSSLRSWCKGKISPYKIPQRLVVLDNLPRNAMGKVTKPALREHFI